MRLFKPVAFALGFAVAATVGTAAFAQDIQDFKVAFARWTGHAPIMVGIEKGIYAAHGLNIKPLFYESGVDMLQGQMGGQQEVSAFGTAPTLTAYSKGYDIVIFGMMSHYANTHNFEPATVIAGPKAGVGVGEIQKLKGKKIGLTLGTAMEQQLQGLLTVAGLKMDDVTPINMAGAPSVTALKTGAVDAIVVTNPQAAIALEQVDNSVPVVVGAGPCTACYDPGFLLTSRDVLEAKKDQLEKFYLATTEAMKYTREHVDEAAEITSRWTEGVDIPDTEEDHRLRGIQLRPAVFEERRAWLQRSKHSVPACRRKDRCRVRSQQAALHRLLSEIRQGAA